MIPEQLQEFHEWAQTFDNPNDRTCSLALLAELDRLSGLAEDLHTGYDAKLKEIQRLEALVEQFTEALQIFRAQSPSLWLAPFAENMRDALAAYEAWENKL